MKDLYDAKPTGVSINHIKQLKVVVLTKRPTPNNKAVVNTLLDNILSKEDILAFWLQIDPTQMTSIRSNFNEVIFTSLITKAFPVGQIDQAKLSILKADIAKLKSDSPFTTKKK
jgi:hypothetical protein